MKFVGSLLFSSLASVALGELVDDPISGNTFQLGFLDGGYSTAEGVVKNDTCYETWGYKAGKNVTGFEEKTGCISTADFPPFEDESNPPTEPTKMGTESWCYLGLANNNDQFVYNREADDNRKTAWKYCTPQFVTTGEGFAAEGTVCKGQWNYNNGSNPRGVINSCVSFDEALPQFKNSNGDDEFSAADFQGKSWCFTGSDPTDTSLGYNPFQESNGELTDKTRQWGVCRDLAATETTGTPTEAPTGSPSEASSPTAPSLPTSPSAAPTGSPQSPTTSSPGTEDPDDSSNTGAIVGGILGGLVAVIVGVALFKYYYRSQNEPAKPASGLNVKDTEQQQQQQQGGTDEEEFMTKA